MMNKSRIDRLKKAAGYQRQAIRALLPEGMDGHLDVIEREIKAMAAELLAGAFTECRETAAKVMTPGGEARTGSDRTADGTETKVKKVTIE